MKRAMDGGWSRVARRRTKRYAAAVAAAAACGSAALSEARVPTGRIGPEVPGRVLLPSRRSPTRGHQPLLRHQRAPPGGGWPSTWQKGCTDHVGRGPLTKVGIYRTLRFWIQSPDRYTDLPISYRYLGILCFEITQNFGMCKGISHELKPVPKRCGSVGTGPPGAKVPQMTDMGVPAVLRKKGAVSARSAGMRVGRATRVKRYVRFPAQQ